MYRDIGGRMFDDPVLSDQLLFEYSPAESLINFELPSDFNIEENDWQLSDLDFRCDSMVSGVDERDKDDSTATDRSPVLFDFADLDKSIDFDQYFLEALNSDRSDDAPQSGTDSTDSGDDTNLGKLSVLGIDLESIYVQNTQNYISAADNKKSIETSSSETHVRSWGEPTFCPELGAFRCPVDECGKLYAKASHVRAHLRRHSGEKPYRCTWGGCAWRFARSDELARHRRSHSGDKPYACSECTKRFARSDHLAKHGRVHARRAAAAAAAARRTLVGSNTLRTRRMLL